MIGVQSYAQKAAAAVERNRVALGRSERRLAEHDAARPDNGDADKLFAWKRERRDLEDRVESDREAFAWAEVKATEAAEAQRTADEDARRAAEERQVRADEKIVREMDALSRKLAAKRDELRASLERTAQTNAKRGSRLYIRNAEERVRQCPARTIPAVTQRATGWFDENGNRPSQLRDDGTGRLVPCDGGTYQWREVEIVQRPETVESASMPKSFAEAFTLVDLEGRAL